MCMLCVLLRRFQESDCNQNASPVIGPHQPRYIKQFALLLADANCLCLLPIPFNASVSGVICRR